MTTQTQGLYQNSASGGKGVSGDVDAGVTILNGLGLIAYWDEQTQGVRLNFYESIPGEEERDVFNGTLDVRTCRMLKGVIHSYLESLGQAGTPEPEAPVTRTPDDPELKGTRRMGYFLAFTSAVQALAPHLPPQVREAALEYCDQPLRAWCDRDEGELVANEAAPIFAHAPVVSGSGLAATAGHIQLDVTPAVAR